jgi:TPR repeat protein
MFNQYPQVVESTEKFESEEDLLYKISLNGYTERDIEKTIERVYLLADDGKLDEASHLLLIAAATESIYAQFILARELYKGNILQRDLTESFTQINQLAQDNYPEAVCDLAQFYEYGIGITKDKKKAFRLYEDALDLGVKRADAHLSRMEEESKGILARLFNKR